MSGKTDIIKGRIKEAAHTAIDKATQAAQHSIDKAKDVAKKMSE
jgi:hypothetical protein